MGVPITHNAGSLGPLLKLWDNTEGYLWHWVLFMHCCRPNPTCQSFCFRNDSIAQAILQSIAVSEPIRWRFGKQLGSLLEGFDQLGLRTKWITRALRDHYCEGDLQSQFSARKGHTEVYWLTDQPLTGPNHLNMAASWQSLTKIKPYIYFFLNGIIQRIQTSWGTVKQ